MTSESAARFIEPFNGPIEIGLRALAILCEAYPEPMALQRLVIFDYLVVHSDDVQGGPPGLHPKTPHRGGELLVRRRVLQDGLSLYRSRGLIIEEFTPQGLQHAATEYSAAFLDSLSARYATSLRDRAAWLVSAFTSYSDDDLQQFIRKYVGEWGAEFAMESVLWEGNS